MIQLNNVQLRKLQQIELELLLEIDRICKKCDIHYNIIAGTMLGAVRHGGFIPWDDDADVAMLRPEYERFREACRTELDSSCFYFQDHNCTPGYRWGYGKLRKKNTLFLREYQEQMPYEQGVFVDIFPLDSVPDSVLKRRILDIECFFIRKMLWSEVGMHAECNFLMRKVYTIIAAVPLKMEKKLLDHMISRARRINSGWVRILMFPTPNRQCGYCRKWYEGSQKIIFEGFVFPGVNDPDEYLSFKYGNYWELPPREKRKTHPVSAIYLTGGIEQEENIGRMKSI